ncbi:MAG TPA: class I SAM-dependent rRNA methyltransferase [Saprospiraceae bacterium]|nr:class I SAM-dependent rRNA methyltransferase [Saprospiraceae bacterium]
MKKVILKNNKTISIIRQHPWIFSGAIHKKDEGIQEGDLVYVYDSSDVPLGFGQYHNASIAVRILSFGASEFVPTFWHSKFEAALHLRKSLGLGRESETNAYRLIHGEGDGLSGLIVDIYDDVAVIQTHTVGMHRCINQISNAITSLYGENIKHIYNKSKESLPKAYSQNINNSFLLGNKEEVIIKENHILFNINVVTGQKTGFFLDQRENRALLTRLARSKTVLNTFCYTGGFSLYALLSGAKKVVSVDSSKKALEELQKNIELNDLGNANHMALEADVIPFLKDLTSDEFDIIILDPPAFAKSLEKRHNAIQAYKRINVLAMQKIKSGGFLLTFSCSQVVTEELFYHTIVAAGIESQRTIRVIRKLSQGPDHPVSLFHPEGSYLKGLVLEII